MPFETPLQRGKRIFGVTVAPKIHMKVVSHDDISLGFRVWSNFDTRNEVCYFTTTIGYPKEVLQRKYWLRNHCLRI